MHSLWHEYDVLFGKGEERVEILNHCASWFFGLTQRVFMREILLGIARLTDNEKTGSHENLTIAALLTDPDLDETSDIAKRIQAAVDQAVGLAEPLRTHRNKYIAHLDHGLAIAKATTVLPAVSSDTITNALEALECAYNEHNRGVRDSDMDFEVRALKSAKSLVEILTESDRWTRFRAAERENPAF